MEDERQLAAKFETVSFERFFALHLKKNQSVNIMLELIIIIFIKRFS